MEIIILLIIALVSGILTSLSPCVLPILPVVLASGIDGNVKRVRGVILGLVLSFTVFAISLSAIVSALGMPADTIRIIAVVLLVGFGLSLAFPKIWDTIQFAIEKVWHPQPSTTQRRDFWGGILTGISLGVVWTPCVGPIVASVATLAAVGGLTLSSVLLVLFYSIGAGLTLYVLAKGGERLAGRMNFIKQNSTNLRRIFGIIIILTGLFIGFGFERQFQAWALNVLPEQWTNLPTVFEDRFNTAEIMEGEEIEIEMDRVDTKHSTAVNNTVALTTDFEGAKVQRRKLLQGCPKQDCIPSLDAPIFETAESAAAWLQEEDVVFAVEHRGEFRAYPQRIMNWHEIVNDQIEGDNVLITFCPLCGSALAFRPDVNGRDVMFGVSGKLHENDLVMYDRLEGNLWQQITGEAIVGPAAQRGETLKQLPIVTTTWEEWVEENPETLVLSRDTGYVRDYDVYPYGTYEQDDRILFGSSDAGVALQTKTVVYGIHVNSVSKAYTEDDLKAEHTITDKVGGESVVVSRDSSGAVSVRLADGTEIIPTRLFWFAWAAFNPDTELYASGQGQ